MASDCGQPFVANHLWPALCGRLFVAPAICGQRFVAAVSHLWLWAGMASVAAIYGCGSTCLRFVALVQRGQRFAALGDSHNQLYSTGFGRELERLQRETANAANVS